MNYRIGQELHCLFAEVDEETNKVVFTWWLYVVRTIRKNRVYATAKNSSTWGKRSKKQGDYGWLVPTDPLYTSRVDTPFSSIFTTRRLALLDMKKSVKENPYDMYSQEHAALILKKVEQQLKTLKTKRRNKT